MIRVGVLGATGRMGRLVIDEVVRSERLQLTAAWTRPGASAIGQDAGTHAGAGQTGVAIRAFDGTDDLADVDVVVDFSAPAALQRLLRAEPDVPLVTGTTGLDADAMDRLRDHAERAPLLVAANFSTGVTLLRDLVERASRALPDYDIEIIEAHHRFKVDAPSGTALALGQAAARGRDWDPDAVAMHGREGASGPRDTEEIGYHAVRGGGIVGEHQVWLVGGGERIQLAHTAIARSAFSEGAVRAARWLVDRPPGLYGMSDVLGLDAT